MYCSIQDIRDEGVDLPDEKIQSAIQFATSVIDFNTGYWFEERMSELRLDGNGTGRLILPVPPINLTSIFVEGEGFLDLNDVVVYGVNDFELIDLDFTSSIERKYGIFPVGHQNVKIAGTFGVVDSNGETPREIWWVCKAIAIKELVRNKLAEAEKFEDFKRNRIIQETTDGHSYMLRPPEVVITGDAYIDNILYKYRKSSDRLSISII